LRPRIQKSFRDPKTLFPKRAFRFAVDWPEGRYVLSGFILSETAGGKANPERRLSDLNDLTLDPVPRIKAKVASIDGVREQDLIVGFPCGSPATFVLVESLCPGDCIAPAGRHSATFRRRGGRNRRIFDPLKEKALWTERERRNPLRL
jgi:hypothetical protein